MSALDAIADPLRLRLVRRLSAGPATLSELAAAAGAHANTTRPHVAALEEAGVVRREPGEPAGRGRPADRYLLARDWTPPTGDFRGLAELLATLLIRGRPDPDELRRTGMEWGRWLAGRPGARDPGRELPRALERLGFDARVEDRVLLLASCPCPLVAPDRPDLVCRLALAVTDGVLAGSGSRMRVAGGDHDPKRRNCSATLAE